MIRILDVDDPKHNKGELVLNAERRGTGAITSTDHGNCYGQAVIASAAKKFGLKHIPACEFYIAPGSRFDKNAPKGTTIYRHICGWAKNKQGYRNMCMLQKLSYCEGFYMKPRIDKELVDRYGDGIIWSDACMGGTISGRILDGDITGALDDFMWYLNRFKDDYYIEYQNHNIPDEESANQIKIQWANAHGVPIIATTDAHFYSKDDADAHRALLCIQWGNWFDNPAFDGFAGDGYWLMNEDELLERFPVEYLNNTQLIVDKVEPNIIEFGNVTPPQFVVPQWFSEEVANGTV
jgi:DNA polymerase-3 subunit alpha